MFTISSIKYDPLILLTHHPQSDDGLTMDKTALSLKYQRKTNEKVVIFDLLAFRQGFYQNEENAKLFLNSYKEQIESLCEFIESNHADAAEKQCVLEVINCYCKKLLSPEAINNANNYLYFTHIKEVIFWLVKFLKCSDMAAKPKEQIIGLVMQAFLRCNKGDSELLNQLLLAKWCSESWQYGFMSLLTSAKELLIKDLLTEFLSGFKLDVVSKLVAKVSKLETPLLNQGLSHIRLSPHCLGLQTGIKKGLTQLGEKQLLGRGKPTHDLEKQLQQFFGEEFSRSFQYQLTQNYSLSSVILYMIEVLYLRLESLLASLNLTSLLTKKTNIDDVFITDGFFHYLEVFFLELVNGILNKIGSRLQYSINDFIEKEAEVSNLNFINIKSRLLRMLTTGITGFCSSIYQRPEFKTSQGAVYGICGVCFWVEDQQHQEHPLTIASLSGIDWWQYEHRMGLLHQAVINTENKEEILAFFTQQKNWQYLSQFNAVEIKTIIKTINSKIIEDPFLEQQLLRKFYQWLLCLTIEKLLSSSLLILLCELSLGASLLKLLLLKLSKADAAQLIVNLPLSLSVRLGAATIFQYLTPEQYQGLAQRFFDANDFYGTKSLLGKHCSPEQIKPTNGKTLSLLALASGASAVNSLGRCFKYDYKQVERGTNWTILMQAAEAGYTQIGSDNLVEEIIKTIPSEMIDNYLNRVNCWGDECSYDC